ncbi:uncharacterized protein isoform X2 [Danio rerio]|uniref:Uncharacterized protein isoform X2 n=1 Tax=Danio rerio TaxID=7955 RepID=A0AC58IGL3_DANRE
MIFLSILLHSLLLLARLPAPVIIRTCPQNSSSSVSEHSEVPRCELLCSVVNVSAVSLSWYKGNSLLSSISVSHLSSSNSLPLEIDHLNESYSCVIDNSFTNRTEHLNFDLCHPCSELKPLYIQLICVAAGLLFIIAAIWSICICKKRKKISQEDQETTEVTYITPNFYKRKQQKPKMNEEQEVVYAGVAVRR